MLKPLVRVSDSAIVINSFGSSLPPPWPRLLCAPLITCSLRHFVVGTIVFRRGWCCDHCSLRSRFYLCIPVTRLMPHIIGPCVQWRALVHLSGLNSIKKNSLIFFLDLLIGINDPINESISLKIRATHRYTLACLSSYLRLSAAATTARWCAVNELHNILRNALQITGT